MKAVLRVLKSGSCSTIQDLGRFAQAHLGVPKSGVMDDYSHRIANWLCGNPATCATLEMTLVGAHFEVLSPCCIAVTGADMDLRINGETAQQWQSHRLRAHDTISLGFAGSGCRTYLAVGGGIATEPVLASRSTYLVGRLGGYEGRMLKAGDVLRCDAVDAACLRTKRRLPWSPVYGSSITLRAIAGPHDSWFDRQGDLFFQTCFTVSDRSDRMGCRLQGQSIKKDADAPENLLSIPVTAGNIQIPPDGQPIVLFHEQTMGGYPCIATVLSCDLWRLAQAQPGATVCFKRVSLEEGQSIAMEWQDFLNAARALLKERRP